MARLRLKLSQRLTTTIRVHNAGEFEDKDHDGRIEAGEYNEYDSLEEAIEAVGYDDNSRSIMITQDL